MGDLSNDQIFVLVRDTALVVLWAVVAFAVTARLRNGGWATLALLGSLLLLISSGVSLVEAKFLFVDHDPSFTLAMADWHLLKVPTVVAFVGSILLAKAVLADRGRRGAPAAAEVTTPSAAAPAG